MFLMAECSSSDRMWGCHSRWAASIGGFFWSVQRCAYPAQRVIGLPDASAFARRSHFSLPCASSFSYFYIMVFLYFLLLLTVFMGSERAAKTRIENNFQTFLWWLNRKNTKRQRCTPSLCFISSSSQMVWFLWSHFPLQVCVLSWSCWKSFTYTYMGWK